MNTVGKGMRQGTIALIRRDFVSSFSGCSLSRTKSQTPANSLQAETPRRNGQRFSSTASALLEDSLRILALAREFRSQGHLFARLDPLGRSLGPYLGEGRYDITKNQNQEERQSLASPSPDVPEEHAQNLRRESASLASSSNPSASSPGPIHLGRLVSAYPWTGPRPERNAFLRSSLGLRIPPAALDIPALAASSAAFLEGGPLPPLPSPHEPCELFEALHAHYCGPLGWEYGHCTTEEERCWWAGRAERPDALTRPERRWLLHRLLRAEVLEDFLAALFPASKRFGLEGCEALVPGVEGLVRRSAGLGVLRMEMGMAHRGRINLLCNVLGKPFGLIATQMKGAHNDFHVGDVIYHGRYENQRYEFTPFEAEAAGGASPAAPDHVFLSVAPNPSHLEAVGPVVQGMARALQEEIAAEGQGRGNARTARGSVLPVLFHGDAAFSGQGVVSEMLNLARLNAYDVGGTVHVVINNQVGFTTDPFEGRSTDHCTDIAKSYGIPIIHVNADAPEAVLRAFRLAADYRATFQKDVLVDLVGYRRQGHNELDNARATQPRAQSRIDGHPRVATLYGARLLAEGHATEGEVAAWRADILAELQAGYDAALAGAFTVDAAHFIAHSWQGEALASLAADSSGKVGRLTNPVQEPTGLPIPTLQWVGRRVAEAPEGFALDPAIDKVLTDRAEMVRSPESRVDWAMAESLALGCLALHQGFSPPGLDANDADAFGGREASLSATSGLNQGHYKIRLTGQDSERGTFAHRHAVIHDVRTGRVHELLNNIAPGFQEPVNIRNSPLSEEATLGFEYGFSLGVRKKGLVLWEAQFGDFSNNAQVMIDQFISSGEHKWGQESGLVLLLPHGYDGQGPDHSSARMERFLQMVADDPDHLPGQSPQQRALIRRTFESLAGQSGQGGAVRGVRLDDVLRVIESATTAANGAGNTEGSGGENGGFSTRAQEQATVLWNELGLAADAVLDLRTWRKFMVSYLRRNAERLSNLFVVNATTPAQYFHVLRRQVNLPYSKPLVLFTPKKLLHHRPCTSALSDFSSNKFFNRVIDDGKESDNTRHLAVSPQTGEPYLLPPDQIRRVVMTTGQIYYQLSAARRAKRIRDVVLVRLEQIAPFPHDRLVQVLNRYPCAEIVWVQEEPKNMGAYGYVQPRLATALQEEYEQALAAEEGNGGQSLTPARPASLGPRKVRYVGRPVSAATATASMSIHVKETKELVEGALAAPMGS